MSPQPFVSRDAKPTMRLAPLLIAVALSLPFWVLVGVGAWMVLR